MQLPTSLLPLLLLAVPSAVNAIIPPRFEPLLAALGRRQCAVPCGYNNAYCCGANSVCYTDAQTKAQCAASTEYSGGAGQVYTTTYVETDLNTITSTWTVWNEATSTYLAQSTAICGADTQACGAICCGAGSYCYASGNCRVSASGAATSTYSSPVKPTSATTSTTVVAVTTTQAFQTPVGTAGGTYGITTASTSSGLSGGAIAGIVIGVIAGIILLIAICACCILKAGFDGLLAIFGLGKNRKRERVITEEERYTRYSGRGSGVAASRRETHGGWFGGGKGRSRVDEKRSSKKEAGLLGGAALGLAGLWAILGLKRKRDERRAPGSEVSYSSYTDSYTGTSASE